MTSESRSTPKPAVIGKDGKQLSLAEVRAARDAGSLDTADFRERECRGCGRTMYVHQRLIWDDRFKLAALRCGDCRAAERRQRRTEATRRWRETVKTNEATAEPYVCDDCGTTIDGVAYRSWRGGGRRVACADCDRAEQIRGVEEAWATTVEQGTPGTLTIMPGWTRTVPDPKTFVPLTGEPGRCEICERQVGRVYEVRDRRTVVWCGDEACQAGAIRLSRRVPEKQARECEQCGTGFTPRRSDARFCSSACRSRWNRERVSA